MHGHMDLKLVFPELLRKRVKGSLGNGQNQV